MVFSRKQNPDSAPPSAPQSNETVTQLPRSDGSVIAHAHHAQAQMPSESVIGNDLSIEGDTITIRCKGSLRVNGDIQADLHSKELEVGRNGRITGSIAAQSVNVFGHVSGAIQGNRVILHASAEVDGDILSSNLAIESGASFDGRSRKARDPNEIQPQLEKPATAPTATAQAVAASPSDTTYEHGMNTGNGTAQPASTAHTAPVHGFGKRADDPPSRAHS